MQASCLAVHRLKQCSSDSEADHIILVQCQLCGTEEITYYSWDKDDLEG